MDIHVKKTYKHYVDGQFIRSESGRTHVVTDKNGDGLTHVNASSRKDLRSSVQAAHKSAHPWAKRSAYNRGQILYRVAEVLSSRSNEFINELKLEGFSQKQAQMEVAKSIELWVSYSGWSDKYQAIFSTVNPVASAHFNFSNPEPVGFVGLDASRGNGFLALNAAIAPIICGGNSVVVIVPNKGVLAALSLAEVFHTSDVPAGVINLLSAPLADTLEHLFAHRDIPSACCLDCSDHDRKRYQEIAADNMKRIRFIESNDLVKSSSSPYEIMAYQEIKTTWHPIGL
jgi:acyl-CoA reductase-like NAD-dependent aldehyde dehydrogenase